MVLLIGNIGRKPVLCYHKILMRTPPCPYYTRCGGCSAQEYPYAEQLTQKRDRLAGILGVNSEDIPVYSGPEFGYRNRIDVAFRPGGTGFREKGRWDSVVDIEHCKIAEPAVNRLLGEIRREFGGLDPFDPETHNGTFRYAVIRSSLLERSVTFILNKDSPAKHRGYERIRAWSGSTTADHVLVGEVEAETDRSVCDDYTIVKGSDHIQEILCGHRIRYHTQGFFQGNRGAAEILIERARKNLSDTIATIRGTASPPEGYHPELLDLYGGVGVFGVSLSDMFGAVTVIENHSGSISCALENMQAAGVNRARGYVRDAADLNGIPFSASPSTPVYVVTDPPRTGMHPAAIRRVCRLAPQVILYISCNPDRLAEDIPRFREYTPERIELVDLFPQTPHMEALVLLVRRPSALHPVPATSSGFVYRVTTNPGLEDIPERELALFHPGCDVYTHPRPFSLDGVVLIESRQDSIEKYLLSLRSVYHVVHHLGHTSLSTTQTGLEELRRYVLSLDIPGMESVSSFRVTAYRSGTHAFHTEDIQRTAGAAIVERFGTRVDLTQYDIDLRLDLSDEDCLAGIQLTHESLDKRYPWVYRPRVTLRTVAAYGLLLLSGIVKKSVEKSVGKPAAGNTKESPREAPEEQPFTLLDPFCGSGTIPIEAVSVLPQSARIIGMDLDPKAVTGAQRNLDACGLSGRVSIQKGDATRLSEYLEPESVDVIVTNPPFGVRLGRDLAFEEFYQQCVHEFSRVLKPGGVVVILAVKDRGTFRTIIKDTPELWLREERIIETGGVYPGVFVFGKNR
jgi:tRNA (guanine6-N2)-methyltransferase